MDSATRAYFEEVERRFIERRGQPLLLSPADVARVAAWNRDGVPLEAVVEGIDIHFEKLARRGRESRRAVTLAYVEDDVLDAWAGLKRRRLGRAGPDAGAAAAPARLATAAEHARLLERVRAAAARCRDGTPPGSALGAALEEAAAKLAAKAPLFDEAAAGHDDERAEDHLRRLEKAILERAREALGPDAVAKLEADAAASLSERRIHVEGSARERALKQLVDRALRERMGLPRLSLFYT